MLLFILLNCGGIVVRYLSTLEKTCVPAAISINNGTLSKEELEELAWKCQVTGVRRRLKAIVLILEGELSRLRVGQKLKVGVQTL